ncbi:MAG: hypothetical protein Q7S72_02080 [Candidatus Taylorbacteria bacterium]|nr:hypothetical protein [Candidatus Taylorbacteria bacterium]
MSETGKKIPEEPQYNPPEHSSGCEVTVSTSNKDGQRVMFVKPSENSFLSEDQLKQALLTALKEGNIVAVVPYTSIRTAISTYGGLSALGFVLNPIKNK